MTTWRTRIPIAMLLACVLVAGCGDDDVTNPSDDPDPDAPLLGRVAVAVVPGGSETVAVLGRAPGGGPPSCTVETSDAGVATVAMGDSTFTVTGVAPGRCAVTVAVVGGGQRSLPVQVYDPAVIDAGELWITFTDEFTRVVHWAAGPGCSVWRPVCPDGYHALGMHLGTYLEDPNGQQAVMVVKAEPGSDAIAFTHDFVLEVIFREDSQFWRPVPPPGYVALGMVATNWSEPDSLACIREDLVVAAEATPEPVYTFNAYDADWSWWGIEQPAAGPHGGAYLAPGHFLFHAGLTPPGVHSLLHVLDVELPQLAEAPVQEFAPTLAGYASPPTETAPRFARSLLVPCTVVRDADHADDLGWRIANSPFYRLERHVYYKLLYHNYNQTSEVQTNQWTVTSGASTTRSDQFHQSTAVGISFETGVDIKFFSSKVTTTVSLEMGFSSQTSVTELEEREVSTSINVAPGKAGALWQEYNRFVLYRHEGTGLAPVASWDFGIDSYVTDEFPD